MEYQTSSRNCLSKIKGQRSVEGQKYDRVPKMVLLRINERISRRQKVDYVENLPTLVYFSRRGNFQTCPENGTTKNK